MKKILSILFAIVVAASASPIMGQTSPLLLPPAVEKDLAAHASDVTEVTLDKNMLAFASKFMSGKSKDDEATRQLIQGLEGIYVRDYEFDKEGQYSMEMIDQLRQHFETSEWSPIVRERERGEITDVMVKMVNGEPHGMFILSAERKELSIVLILGPIRMDQLGALRGLSGLGALGALGDLPQPPHGKAAGKEDKEKTKDKKGGGE